MKKKLLIVAVVVIGLPAFLELVHSFFSFDQRSKQLPAKHELRQLCEAQQKLLANNTFSATYRGLGFELRHNTYAYFISPRGELEHPDHSTKRPEVVDPEATGVQIDLMYAPRVLPTSADVPSLLGGVKLGANGECPRCAWVMVAIGNVDVDPDLDIWSVSTEDRVAPDGTPVGKCTPYLERSDIDPGPIRHLFR